MNKSIRRKVEIKYLRRKYNKEADKLSKRGKTGLTRSKLIVDEKAPKISQRLFDGEEIDYSKLSAGDSLDVRVYMKDAVQREFEVTGEISDGNNFGKTVKIYVSFIEELGLHRHHYYRFTVKEVYKHHIRVMPDFEEIESG